MVGNKGVVIITKACYTAHTVQTINASCLLGFIFFFRKFVKVSHQVDWMYVAVLVFVVGEYLSQVRDVAGGQPQRVQLGEFGVRRNPR